jgi:hypothetical protein
MPLSRTQEEWLRDGAACLEAALLYAGRGWSPIPLCPPDHVGVGKDHGGSCDNPGKRPLVNWDDYQEAPAPEGEIRSWWRRWPNANVGLAMGPGGLVTIDTDGPHGEEALARFLAEGGVQTLEFNTPNGRRRLYSCEARLMLTPRYKALEKKQELRILGKGAQTVAPPSRHETGGHYLWITDLT